MDAQTHEQIHELWEAIRSIEKQINTIKKDIGVWEDELYNLKKQIEKLTATELTHEAHNDFEPSVEKGWVHEETKPLLENGQSYWFLDDRGDIRLGMWIGVPQDNDRLEIGNIFSSKELAELARKKLMAWKRLREKGFEFYGYHGETYSEESFVQISFQMKELTAEMSKDLDLLFGEDEQ